MPMNRDILPIPSRRYVILAGISIFERQTFWIARELDKIAARFDPASPETIEYGFEQLASRFDHYLRRLHNEGNEQRGIIIFDKSTYERTIQSLARIFRESGHRWGSLRNFAEVPIFIDSQSSRLIQLADLVAYAIFRNFELGDNQFYKIIANRFDAEGDAIHGLYVSDVDVPYSLASSMKADISVLN